MSLGNTLKSIKETILEMHKLSQEFRIALRKKIIKALNEKKAAKVRDDYILEIVACKGNIITLEELQINVGGYIEVYPQEIIRNTILFVDEEGLLKKRPYNQLAKDLFDIDIVGDILFVPKELLNDKRRNDEHSV